MQHLITFRAKISWEGRANGLPEELSAFTIFEDNDAPPEATKAAINDVIEKQVALFLRAQGMFVQRDQGQIIDLTKVPQDRIYVPFHWIVSLRATLKPLAVELSNPDEQGIERFKDGSEPLKN